MSDHTSHTETNCWSRLKNDDPQALSYFYDNYIDRLFLTAMSITHDREMAKDALQEVFIELWHYRKSIDDVRNTQAYLTRMLKSILFKKMKTGLSVDTDVDLSQFSETTFNREESLIADDVERDRRSRLKSALSGLSEKQQLILRLRFHENLTYDQIADKLGMKYQSVNNLVFRTFRRLRGVMSHFLSISFLFTAL